MAITRSEARTDKEDEMNRYDFNVITCCHAPNGGILRSAAIHAANAPSEHEARAIIVHGIVDAGGWVEAIQRIHISDSRSSDGTGDRYNLSLVIRDDSEFRGGKEVQHNCNAGSELEARRDALERAWANGCLVTQFLKVSKQRG
jgi:hypothetical protein